MHRPSISAPLSGRLWIRQTGQNQIIAGVLHLPSECKPIELDEMLIDLRQGRVRLVDGVPQTPPHYPVHCLTDELRQPRWHATSLHGCGTVRAVRAFPCSNGWTVCGLSHSGFIVSGLDPSGHAFLDVCDGSWSRAAIECDTRGMAVAQVMRDLALWPDSHGTPHTLPILTEAARTAYWRHANLLADLADDVIDEGHYHAAKKTDLALSEIECGRLDRDYAKFLAEMRRSGFLIAERAQTAEELIEREDIVRELTNRLVIAQREEELSELAHAVGVKP